VLPKAILEQKLIPIVRGLTAAAAPGLVGALQEGGSSVVEVTLESEGGLEAIRSISNSGMTVGAGTVMTVDQAEAAVDAGAQFLVSPHLDPYLVTWSLETRVPYLPGVFTPTEVAAVMSLGLITMKLFPANVGGPGLVSSLLGPFPEVELVATGGVNADNKAGFLASGAVAVGVGGWLTGQDDLEVTRRTRALLESGAEG